MEEQVDSTIKNIKRNNPFNKESRVAKNEKKVINYAEPESEETNGVNAPRMPPTPERTPTKSYGPKESVTVFGAALTPEVIRKNHSFILNAYAELNVKWIKKTKDRLSILHSNCEDPNFFFGRELHCSSTG